MNVGQLKKLLANSELPDDAKVLGCGSDHSHYEVKVDDFFAAKFTQGRSSSYFEYFGDEHLDEGETKVPALIIR